MQSQSIHYQDDTVQLEGFLAFDSTHKDKRPTILLVHDWSGCGEFIEDKAQYFAKKGYIGFGVDLYGKNNRGSKTDNAINQKLMQPFIDDRSLIISRLQSAIEHASTIDIIDSEKLVVIGFCFGGLCALDLARANAPIQGAISVHGLLFPPNDKKSSSSIKPKVLVLHGNDDPLVPPEQIQDFQTEMTAANADWQLHNFGNTLHAFTNPLANSPKFDPEGNPPSFGAQFNIKSNERSFLLIDLFLKEMFS